MVNMVDTEKLMKSLLAQFCETHFKCRASLQILGSVHVIADNIEVLTCLLNEKLYTSPRVVTPPSTDPSLNLVTTLQHLHHQQGTHLHQQLKVNQMMIGGGAGSDGKTNSLCSSSSSSSSSTYSSGSSTSKRKRFTPRTISGCGGDDDSAIASAHPSSSLSNAPLSHATQDDALSGASKSVRSNNSNTDEDDDTDEDYEADHHGYAF